MVGLHTMVESNNESLCLSLHQSNMIMHLPWIQISNFEQHICVLSKQQKSQEGIAVQPDLSSKIFVLIWGRDPAFITYEFKYFLDTYLYLTAIPFIQ